MDDTARPRMMVEEVPSVFPQQEAQGVDEVVQKLPVVSKRSFSFRALVFIVPGVLLLVAILVGMYLADIFFEGNEQVVVTSTPFPSLIPATPVASLAPVSKLLLYVNGDGGFKFSYLDDVEILECAGRVELFANKSVQKTCEGMGVVSVIYDEDQFESIQGFETSGKELGERKLLVVLRDERYRNVYQKVVLSLKALVVDTSDWSLYENAVGKYSFLYPSDWKVTELESGNVVVQKDEEEKDHWIYLVEYTGSVSDAELTASEISSSTVGLAGWDGVPEVNVRNLSGGTAQVIEGKLGDVWQVYVVLWYKDRLYQMSWVDTLSRQESANFEAIISSFELVN